MICEAVIGVGFGDEGKGKVVDYLCSKNPGAKVIRFSGGPQASHRVCTEEGKAFVFSTYGSGTLRGSDTYLAAPVYVDPSALLAERQLLLQMGVQAKIFIHPKCPIITPVEIALNGVDPRALAEGTCGSGIFETFKRESAGYHITWEDVVKQEAISKFVRLIHRRPEASLHNSQIEDFIADLNDMLGLNGVNTWIDADTSHTFNVIFEGSQGLMLDAVLGTYPHVTPSRTGSHNILEMGYRPHINLVTRAFCSRHGNGPMPEMRDFRFKVKHEHNTFNRFQGKFRRTLLDTSWIKAVLRNDSYISEQEDKTLWVNHYDTMDGSFLTQSASGVKEHRDAKQMTKYLATELGCKTYRYSDTDKPKFKDEYDAI